LSKEGQYPSIGPPTYQIIKVLNANHMNAMKTSLTIFPCVLGSAFLYIRVCLGLSFATKRIGPPCCTLLTLFTFCSLLLVLSQNYLSPTISVLAEKTLLKTAYHFLLLLIGFDTLTYQKDYDRSPILVGHQDSFLAPLPGSEAPLVRKNLFSVMKFSVTCYYGK
jgi:hypothetical protein